MIINLSDDVNDAMLTPLLKAITDLKTDEKLTIYFTCPDGGFTDAAMAIIDIINSNKEVINMIYYGELFSSGMIIFLGTKCNKKILRDTRGMYHFAWQQMSINETGKPSGEYDIFSMKEMKKSKIRTLEFLSTTKLSQKEIAQIKLGKDVYFSYDRMLELI